MAGFRRVLPGFAILQWLAVLPVAAPLLGQVVVKTVPWNPGNAAQPHVTYSGKLITLKGTADVQGANYQFKWDFGDGSPSTAYTAYSDRYNLSATHIYSGAIGQLFVATLYVRDTSASPALEYSEKYYVQVRDKTLPVEVDVAIDEGLWWLHKCLAGRSGTAPTWTGSWRFGCAYGNQTNAAYRALHAQNLSAFLVNGHKPGGIDGDRSTADFNPYTETVERAMNDLFEEIQARFNATPNYWNQAAGGGVFNTDTNGNGILLYADGGFEDGFIVDAIVATGLPEMTALSGGIHVRGRKFKDIVQDQMDNIYYCMNDTANGVWEGGWRYGCNFGSSDGSVNQWNAIAALAASRKWGIPLPANVTEANKKWLDFSNFADGRFGYTGKDGPWGYFATTPSGMVQMAMDGVGKTNTKWINAMTFLRNNWGTSSGAANEILDYYYGLFSFTRAMIFHRDGANMPESLDILHSTTPGVPDLAWYRAEIAAGDAKNGVARTLVNEQNGSGYWLGNAFCCGQEYFTTAQAILMLTPAVCACEIPVAVAEASPSTLANGGCVKFDGKKSFHQDPARTIVKYEWDFDDGAGFATVGAQATKCFNVPPPYPKAKNVRLRVTDDSTPGAASQGTIQITIANPPNPPTANAGGPYNICPQPAYLPFYLDGLGSANPDNGQSEPGAPPDFIKSYSWDLDGDGTYGDLTGAQPRVDNFPFFAAKLGTGQVIAIGLKVTDNTALSYPTSGKPAVDLSSFGSTEVYFRAAVDPFCSKCVSSVTARGKRSAAGKPGLIEVIWTETGAHHYNVYRSDLNNGPYALVGSAVNPYPGTNKTMVLTDNNAVTGKTYYYRVHPALANDTETCQSNQAFLSTPVPR